MKALLHRLAQWWRRHLISEAGWHLAVSKALQDAARRLSARDRDPTDEAGA